MTEPPETEITEALDACVKAIDAIQEAWLNNKAIRDIDTGTFMRAHDMIYDIYQELGRL